MPRITQGFEIGPASPARAVDSRIAQAAGNNSPQPPRAAQASTPRPASAVLDPGTAPVDIERVGLIRKAIEQGTYPVIPARIADAVIAAGMLLRSPSHG